MSAGTSVSRQAIGSRTAARSTIDSPTLPYYAVHASRARLRCSLEERARTAHGWGA